MDCTARNVETTGLHLPHFTAESCCSHSHKTAIHGLFVDCCCCQPNNTFRACFNNFHFCFFTRRPPRLRGNFTSTRLWCVCWLLWLGTVRRRANTCNIPWAPSVPELGDLLRSKHTVGSVSADYFSTSWVQLPRTSAVRARIGVYVRVCTINVNDSELACLLWSAP